MVIGSVLGAVTTTGVGYILAKRLKKDYNKRYKGGIMARKGRKKKKKR